MSSLFWSILNTRTGTILSVVSGFSTGSFGKFGNCSIGIGYLFEISNYQCDKKIADTTKKFARNGFRMHEKLGKLKKNRHGQNHL